MVTSVRRGGAPCPALWHRSRTAACAPHGRKRRPPLLRIGPVVFRSPEGALFCRFRLFSRAAKEIGKASRPLRECRAAVRVFDAQGGGEAIRSGGAAPGAKARPKAVGERAFGRAALRDGGLSAGHDPRCYPRAILNTAASCWAISSSAGPSSSAPRSTNTRVNTCMSSMSRSSMSSAFLSLLSST